ncbi:hypothetical protein BDD12DRAFT_877900 [Trichophaea hybrida]|nr:hypothetical protein BDD12DRAFT_877900 [Trichophaea hybrida]
MSFIAWPADVLTAIFLSIVHASIYAVVYPECGGAGKRTRTGVDKCGADENGCEQVRRHPRSRTGIEKLESEEPRVERMEDAKTKGFCTIPKRVAPQRYAHLESLCIRLSFSEVAKISFGYQAGDITILVRSSCCQVPRYRERGRDWVGRNRRERRIASLDPTGGQWSEERKAEIDRSLAEATAANLEFEFEPEPEFEFKPESGPGSQSQGGSSNPSRESLERREGEYREASSGFSINLPTAPLF